MPAILFHFDRSNCERLIRQLNAQLEKEEAAYKDKHKVPERLKAIEKEITDLEKWKDKLESKWVIPLCIHLFPRQMQETSKTTKDFKLSPSEKAQLEKLEGLKVGIYISSIHYCRSKEMHLVEFFLNFHL